MEINWILKMMVFGSNLSTDDIINLMFEAPRGGPKADDGVKETPKNADVICEQPLTRIGIMTRPQAFGFSRRRACAASRAEPPDLVLGVGGGILLVTNATNRRLIHEWTTRVVVKLGYDDQYLKLLAHDPRTCCRLRAQ